MVTHVTVYPLLTLQVVHVLHSYVKQTLQYHKPRRGEQELGGCFCHLVRLVCVFFSLPVISVIFLFFLEKVCCLASFFTHLHSKWNPGCSNFLSFSMWNITSHKLMQSAGFPTSYSNVSKTRKGTVKGVIGYSCPTPGLEPALPRFHPGAAVSHLLHSLETQ